MSVGKPLLADADRARAGGADRALVEVAVGVLIRPDGDFLLTSRPDGKVYAGFWEFPGGKVEAGESVEQAFTANSRKNSASSSCRRSAGGSSWWTIPMPWCG